MDLYLLRHGVAAGRVTGAVKRDRDRPLTHAGAKQTQRIAKGMRRLGLSFDLILTSPYVRARETADIVAAEFDAGVKESTLLEPGKSYEPLVALIAARWKTTKSMLMVGHEPDLSRLISILVCGHPGLRLKLKKGGLCRLTVGKMVSGRCGVLTWVLAPRHMARA